MDDDLDELINSGCLSWGVFAVLFCALMSALILYLLITIYDLL